MSSSEIQLQALKLATMLGHREFKASNEWLCKFKERNGISLKNTIDEARLVDQASVQNWISNVLPDMIKDYAIDDIFNADETYFLKLCRTKQTCTRI